MVEKTKQLHKYVNEGRKFLNEGHDISNILRHFQDELDAENLHKLAEELSKTDTSSPYPKEDTLQFDRCKRCKRARSQYWTVMEPYHDWHWVEGCYTCTHGEKKIEDHKIPESVKWQVFDMWQEDEQRKLNMMIKRFFPDQDKEFIKAMLKKRGVALAAVAEQRVKENSLAEVLKQDDFF